MSRTVVRMTIDDAEHISPERRAEIIASYPEHEREARIKGIPALGSGRIFPIAEDSLLVDPIAIPKHWATIGGIDFGWDHPTAAVKLAHDRDNDRVYVVNCYRVKEQTPLIHAGALKAWGGKMPWAWPQDAYQRDKIAGKTLKDEYTYHGLNMVGEHAQFADGGNSVEAGLMMMLERMQLGKLKVFRNYCDMWLDEFRLYHRKDGLVVKEYDDLIDATRYAIMMLRFATLPDEAAGWAKPKEWTIV